jgi:hypothetical protein
MAFFEVDSSIRRYRARFCMACVEVDSSIRRYRARFCMACVKVDLSADSQLTAKSCRCHSEAPEGWRTIEAFMTA